MFLRHLMHLLGMAFLGLAALVTPAVSGETIHSSGFGSTGIAMGTWRWLANDRRDAHITWTFTDSRILTDDLHLRFQGLAALAPSSTGSLTLRLSYGHPGSAQLGGSFAKIDLQLTPASGGNAIVGVQVAGDLLVSSSMMNALGLRSRQLAIRLDQADNPSISIAFRREDLSVTASPAGGDTTNSGQAEGNDQSGGDGTVTDGGTQGGGTVTDGGTQGGGTVTEGGTQGGGTVTDGGTQGGGTVTDGGTQGGGTVTDGGTQGGGTVTDGGTQGGGTVTDGGTQGGGTVTDGGTQGGGTVTDGGVVVAIDVTDGGRTLTSSVPFLVNKPGDQVLDPDNDGILQRIENLAMAQLNPLVELDEDENWLGHRTIDKVVNFTTVSPYPSARVPRYIVFVFGTTWARDHGRDPMPDQLAGADVWNEYIAKRHNGDIEKVALAWEIVAPTRAELRSVYLSAHDGPTQHSAVWKATGTTCNKGKVFLYPSGQTICASLEFVNGRLKVAASEDKHAYYPTVAACEEVRLVGTIGEDCGGGPTLTFPAFNIGEFGETERGSNLQIGENIGALFPGEKLSGPSWWPDGNFCGGRTSTFMPDMPCSGSIASTMNGIPTMLESSLMSAPLGLPDGTAEMHEHANFHGFSVGLTTNTEIADLSHMWGGTTDVEDMISSLKVGRGISCRFYEHPNYTGKVIGPIRYQDAPNGEWPDLSIYEMNDKISSVRCEASP